MTNVTDNLSGPFDLNRLGRILEEKLFIEMKRYLLDPDLNKIRNKNVKEKNESVAVSQGENLLIYEDELKEVMNSSYVYLLYVSEYSFDKKTPVTLNLKSVFKDEKNLKNKKEGVRSNFDEYRLTLGAGAVLYRLNIDKDGQAKMVFVKRIYKTFVTSEKVALNVSKDKNSLTLLETNLQKGLIVSFLRHVKTKLLKKDPFLLTGQVVSIDAQTYTLNVGNNEGVLKDDLFYLMEEHESDKGGELIPVGLLNISSIGVDQSKAVWRWGETTTIGTKILEKVQRKINLDFSIGQGIFDGKKDNLTSSNGTKYAFLGKGSSVYNIVINGHFNLVDYLNISQFYLTLKGTARFVSRTDESKLDASVSGGVSLGGGVMKKFLFGRGALRLSLGLDKYFSRVTGIKTKLSEFNFTNHRIEFYMGYVGVGYELMIRPSWGIFFDGTYGLGGSSVTLLSKGVSSRVSLGGNISELAYKFGIFKHF